MLRDGIIETHYNNERSIGKQNVTYQYYKPRRQKTVEDNTTRKLKIVVNPPTIPTKYQTFHYDESESRGFNSTAPRFGRKLHELPAPGTYSTTTPIITQEPSVSKKGLGGFASQTNRFPTTTHRSGIKVGPGSYDLTKDPTFIRQPSHKQFSPAFAPPVAVNGGQRFKEVTKSDMPAPGRYSDGLLNNKIWKSGPISSGASSVFKSRTARQTAASAQDPLRDLPPPGSYEVKDDILKSGSMNAGAAAFKASPRKWKSVSEGVGPGHYNLLDNTTATKKAEHAWKSKLFSGFVASLASMQKSETKKSQPPKAPGPGAYDIDRAYHALKRDDARGVKISPVKSNGVKSKNRVHKSEEHYHPVPKTDVSKLGPAYYKTLGGDVALKRKSYHVQTTGEYWV